MRALRFYNQRDIRLEDVDKPMPGDGEVLIKVTHSGISQTQVNEFMEGPYLINAISNPLTEEPTPLIPGHEFGGVIESVGPNADPRLVGVPVAVLPRKNCGECEQCASGHENLCQNLNYYGLVGAHGGFAEYAAVSAKNIYPVGAIDTSLYSFIEPLLVGVNAGRQIEDRIQGSKILVLGAGGVGVCVAAVLKDYFGGDVTISDILPFRLQKAGELGLKTLNQADLACEYDVVVDCAGSDPASQNAALFEGAEYLKPTGILLMLGSYFHELSFVPFSLLAKQIQLRTSFAYDSYAESKLDEVLETLEPDFNVLIHEISLDEIIDEGYFRSEVDKNGFVRIVVRP